MSNQNNDLILKEKGRHTNEDAFVMIKNGEYLGYGFVDKSDIINHSDDLQNYLIPQKNNMDIQKILRPYVLNI